MEAVEGLAVLSQDKIKRYAYERRLDELGTYNRILKQIKDQAATIKNQEEAIKDQAATIAALRAQLDSLK